jgi:chemotaxis protein CheZ
VQRKVFRVEAMLAEKRPMAAAYAGYRRTSGERPPRPPAYAPPDLASLSDTLAGHKRDLGNLIGHGDERHMARAADELAAAIDGMEAATQTILKSVEAIDDSAKALSASIKEKYKRGLAQDIQDNVLRVYESCNFQDIAGQRIGKAMKTLAAIERQVADMLARCDGNSAKRGAAPPASNERGLLNGPRLGRDTGHASQNDIDRMFG